MHEICRGNKYPNTKLLKQICNFLDLDEQQFSKEDTVLCKIYTDDIVSVTSKPEELTVERVLDFLHENKSILTSTQKRELLHIVFDV